jgi:hypothetical protein
MPAANRYIHRSPFKTCCALGKKSARQQLHVIFNFHIFLVLFTGRLPFQYLYRLGVNAGLPFAIYLYYVLYKQVEYLFILP